MQIPQSVVPDDATSEYRKLVTALAFRALRSGSRDAEGAAQEALRRSLANPLARAAVEYYFHHRPSEPVDAPPEWPLERLFAWLHGVLRFVVREESARVGYRREVLTIDGQPLEIRDPSPNQLQRLIDSELQTIVRQCLSALSDEYRTVIALRAKGLKYSEIAARLGVNENTVATRVRRATQAIARELRQRMEHQPAAASPNARTEVRDA